MYNFECRERTCAVESVVDTILEEWVCVSTRIALPIAYVQDSLS
jgi:hypothetical protein